MVVFGDSMSDVGRTLTAELTDDAGQRLEYFNRRFAFCPWLMWHSFDFPGWCISVSSHPEVILYSQV